MAVLNIAEKENRILLTNDKDFGEIVFRLKRASAGIILFRVKGQDTKEKIKLFKKLLETHKDKLGKHFVVVTNEKFRFKAIKGVSA